MGLLSGSASVTRFTVTSQPEEPEFDEARFVEITPGSSIRERIGFLPFEPDAPYRIGEHRLAFRVRIDKVSPDPTAVKERLKEMIVAERDASSQPVGGKRRRHLRNLAEEEVMLRSTPRSKVVECCIDGSTLWVGSTANNTLGLVVGLLGSVEVIASFRTPWSDHGDNDIEHPNIDASGPGEAVLGCRFLRALLKDHELMAEPETGAVKLLSGDATVTISGGVQNELTRYLERGAETLSAKLVMDEFIFRLDGLRHRISGLRLNAESWDSWIELLDQRLELVDAVYKRLDVKYDELRDQLAK